MFASAPDRLALRASNSNFDPCPFVVQFEKNGRRSEIAADGVDHALELNAHWIAQGANYVEVFRVLDDGTLNPTIGSFGALH